MGYVPDIALQDCTPFRKQHVSLCDPEKERYYDKTNIKLRKKKKKKKEEEKRRRRK